MSSGTALYNQIVKITEDYIGPAAKQFIDNHIQNHFAISPSNLSYKDMPELIEWIKISMSYLTSNTALIEDYVQRLSDISQTES